MKRLSGTQMGAWLSRHGSEECSGSPRLESSKVFEMDDCAIEGRHNVEGQC